MSAADEYRSAQKRETDARLSRAIALRAMLCSGTSQREVAAILGISQSAVSRQLRSAPAMESVPAAVLLEAATPVLRLLAAEHHYQRLAVFGSVARGTAHADSDIDLIVDAPPGTSSFEFIKFKRVIEEILGREIDLISWGGLNPAVDGDILESALLL